MGVWSIWLGVFSACQVYTVMVSGDCYVWVVMVNVSHAVLFGVMP
jgi:hypothetical protein